MNAPSDIQDEGSHDEAARWAARLDGSSLTAESSRELAAWLEADPRRRQLLSEYCQFSIDLDEHLSALLAAETSAPPAIPPHPVARRRLWRWRLALGAGLAAAAGFALFLWLQPPARQIENVATPAGQRQALSLVDGSQIDLDARTSLRVEINARQRRVQLAAGEAFFVISKDASRPFIVTTPAGSVRVTGTEFNVQTFDAASLAVTVLRGVVLVSPAGDQGAPVRLLVGDQLRFSPAGVTVRKLTSAQLQDAVAWRQGQIAFHGAALSDALADFARYHGIGITVDPAVAALRVGGRFSLDDLDGFLSALEVALPVRVSRGLNGAIRVDRRQNPSGGASGA